MNKRAFFFEVLSFRLLATRERTRTHERGPLSQRRRPLENPKGHMPLGRRTIGFVRQPLTSVIASRILFVMANPGYDDPRRRSWNHRLQMKLSND